MNLETLKNTYAQEQGHENWEQYFINHFVTSQFSRTGTLSVFENVMDKICIRAQKALQEKTYESINADDVINLEWENIHKSITNPENLIR